MAVSGASASGLGTPPEDLTDRGRWLVSSRSNLHGWPRNEQAEQEGLPAASLSDRSHRTFRLWQKQQDSRRRPRLSGMTYFLTVEPTSRDSSPGTWKRT